MTNRYFYKFVHLLIINFYHFAEIHSIKPDDQNIWATLSKLPSKSNEVNITLRRRHQSSTGSMSQGDLPKIIGSFSSVGPQEDAKGIIKLLHWCPLGDMMIESPWVALFKDEPFSPCVPSLEPIRIAISKGANAVIVYSEKDLPIQLKDQQKRVLHKPLVLLQDTDVNIFKDIPYLEHDAIAKINAEVLDKSLEQVEHRDYYTISIFLGTLLVLSLISIAAILKFKGRWHKKEPCATQIAKRVLKSMETRKFNFSDHWFFTESCAVCLEEYIPGQEVRILPCRHEFHKSCVDGWLINRRTCPLCLSNILDRPNGNRDGYIYTSKQPPTHTGGGSTSEAVSSSAVVPGNYRRRYDYVDDSIEAEQFGYIQQGFYRHSGEVGCVYGGYPTGSQEGITISAPYEDNNSFSTQAIVPEHRDQMIVACNTRNDEVDSVTEEPSVCRGNLGIDRLMVRDRHKRFSCRRSTPLSTGSYWGVGGSRAMRARRTILPEYSRLRIKLRQCDKNKNNSLIVNNNNAVSFQQKSASPINNNLSQLKVLPQQHAQQQQRHFVSNDDSKQQVMSHFGPMQVTSLSLKQTNNTIPASIHTSNTTTSTLPKCKKQLVNNDSNNLTTSAPNENKNNATICYNKRRRPPCCSLEDEDEFIWRSSSTFSTVLALNSGSYRSAIKLGCINKLSELSNNHCNNNANNSLVISNFGGCCRLGKFNHKQNFADNNTHNPKCLANNHNNDCQLNKNNFCNILDNKNTENCCKEANSQVERTIDNNANKNDCHYHYCCYGDQRCANASSSSHYHTLPGRRPHCSHHHRHHHHHLHQFPQPKQHIQEANKNSASKKFPFEKKEVNVKQNNDNITAYNFSNKSNIPNTKNTRVLNATELDSYKLNNNNENKTYKSKDLANILFDQSKSSFAPTTSSPPFIPTCNFSTPPSLLTSLNHSKNNLPNKSIDSKSNKGTLSGFNKPSGSVIMPLSVKVVQRSSHKNSALSLNRLPSCDSTPPPPPPPPPSLLSTGSASTGKVRRPKMPTPQGQQRNREPGNFPLSRSLGREIAGGFLEGCVDCQRGLEMVAEKNARNNNLDVNKPTNNAASETKDTGIQMDF